MRHAIILAASVLIAPLAAHARDCEPVFANSTQSVTITPAEIDARAVAVENLDLRVRNAAGGERSGGGTCSAILRVSRTDGTIDPDFPRYQLRAPTNQDVQILATSTQGKTPRSDIMLANLPGGSQGRNVPLQIVTPTEWGLKAGTYSEQLLVSMYDEAGTVRDQTTVNLIITIPPAVSVRIVGAIGGGRGRGGARIDLGDLSKTSETHSQPFGARILSTTAYGVSFTSENRGALINTGGKGEIPYRLYYEGKLVDLAGANFYPEARHTSASGDVRGLQVVVPPVTAAAGLYRDRVTVLVTAI